MHGNTWSIALNKITLWVVAALLLGAATAANAAAQDVRVVFVNTPRILEQAPQAKAAGDKLQEEFAPKDADLSAKQKRLKDQEDKLVRDGPVLGDSERRKMERDLLSQQRELKRARDEFNEDLNLRRNEELSKLQRVVADAIVKIAKERKLDMVFETGVVYASDRVDITEEVLERLRKQFAESKK